MEDQSYVKVLEYRKRNAILSFNTLFFLLTEIILVGMTIIIGLLTKDGTTATFLFVVMVVFILAFTTVFIDTFFNLNLFYPKRNTIGIIFLMSAVGVVSVLISLDFIGWLFVNQNGETVTTFLFATLLIDVFMSYYFLYQAKSVGEDKTLIGKFEVIREELKLKPLSSLGLNVSIERALKWLQYEQSEEGYWHYTTPLYETAEILESIFLFKNDLSYQWQSIFNGVEETRTAEQVFYNVLDANNTSIFSENYFNLYPRKVIGFINAHIQNPKVSSVENAIEKIRTFTPVEDQRYSELLKKTAEISAWDFITELEKGSSDPDFEIPHLLVLGQIATLRMENDYAQAIADIISETFNIVLSRATTRFNMRGEKQDVSDLVLGLMYNSLIEMREYNRFMVKKLDDIMRGKSSAPEPESPGIPSIILPDLETPSSPEDPHADPSIPGIPNIEDSSNNMVPNLPDLEDTPKESEEVLDRKLSIDLRLGLARNHILKKQSFDGGWSSDALTTAECLASIAHNESVESEAIKMGVNFLLAIQKSNGSWNDDYVVTSRVLRTLMAIIKRVMVQF